MGMFFHSSDGAPERSPDPAQRRANLRRIGPLFRPYKVRLGGVLLLIVVPHALMIVLTALLLSDGRLYEAATLNEIGNRYNIPAYVPPGHGLVYLAGVSLATLCGARVVIAVGAAAAATWGLAGLTVLRDTDGRVITVASVANTG